MRLGVHVRIAKGLASAVTEAERIGCETIQIFAGNPNAWRESFPTLEAVEAFRNGISRLDIRPVTLHTAYLLNLATSNDLIYSKSVQALKNALERAKLLGAEYVVTHIGSHGGAGFAAGVKRIQEAVTSALAASPGSHMLLLEGGSGAGNTIGSTFEQMAVLLNSLTSVGERVGIALDTAHLWGAGYDVSTVHGVNQTLDEFDNMVGLSRLRLVHCNDTRVELGSHLDRHWHIGEGNIGIEGFRTLVNHPALSDLSGILETPMDEPGWDVKNLNLLKSLRGLDSRPQ
ncbi:MAG: deoxyribonuclease IV [Armatimonadota bacterium]|nr:deoxyribonuclease IV [Armatimonadota bacterium]